MKDDGQSLTPHLESSISRDAAAFIGLITAQQISSDNKCCQAAGGKERC